METDVLVRLKGRDLPLGFHQIEDIRTILKLVNALDLSKAVQNPFRDLGLARGIVPCEEGQKAVRIALGNMKLIL
jgi:hypothetical protein